MNTKSRQVFRVFLSSIGAFVCAALSAQVPAPVILVQPQSQTVLAGGSINLSVTVSNGFSTATLPTVSSGTLRMWLKADAGVVTNSGGQVTQWQDQSGNNNNAFAPTAAAQPSLVRPPGLGGNAAIRFDGIQDNVNGDYLRGTNDVGIPDAYTAFKVYNVLQSTNTENVFTLIGYPGRYYGECRIDGVNAGRMGFSGWAYDYPTSFTVPTNTYRIWTDRMNTNLSQIELFDTTASSNTNFSFSLSQFSAPAPGFFIGGLDPSWQYVVNGRNFNGDIAELLYFRGQLSDADRLAVQQYLSDKYLGTSTIGLTFQWRFNGSNIADATNSSFTITNAQIANGGSYDVVICGTNYAGCTTSSAASLGITGGTNTLSQGLIAYYPFSGNANDASGNGNDGSPTNVTYNTDRFGQPGAAADFSSGNAYVEIPTLNAMAYNPVTYSVWFKLNGLPTVAEERYDGEVVMTLVGREISGAISPAGQTDGALSVFNLPNQGWTNQLIYFTGGAGVASRHTPPTNTWIQVVFTLDASNNATFYWNGQYANSTVFTAAQNAVIPFRIGASASLTDYRVGWKGEIDDVRIYNRALSSNEVAQLYSAEAPAGYSAPSIQTQPLSQTVNQGTSVSFSVSATGTAPLTYQWSKDGANITGATNTSYTIGSVQPPNIGNYTVVVVNPYGSATSSAASLGITGLTNTLSQGLIAYYPFSGNANDASGNGNDGNPTNVTYNTDRFGQPGTAADFSSGNAYVEIPTLNAMAYYPVTYSAWFKLNSLPTAAEERNDGLAVMTLLGRDISGNSGVGALSVYNAPAAGNYNQLIYYCAVNGVPSQHTPPTNAWIQVVFTLDASNNATFYWNGQYANSTVFTAPQNAVIPFRIGASASFADYRLGWKGEIDDVRVYNRVLSSNEVAQLYASEAPAGYSAPSIQNQPQSQTVSQGAAASFSVGAIGTAPISYQWNKNGVNITGATNTSYTIGNVQPPNVGSYSVVVSNPYGSATSSPATLSITGVTNTLSQGLIAYYPFSGNANDASGNGNNGNPTNVTYNTDRFGQAGAAADFSAGNAYVEVPTLNAMSYHPVTYSAWFKLNGFTTAAEQRGDGFSFMTLVGRELSGSPNEGALGVLNLPGDGWHNQMIYYSGSAGVGSTETPATNTWVQVVFTIDSANNATFYWNGQYANSTVFTAAQSMTLPFRIGASASFADYRVGWKGEVDDVRIYNRALSSNEVVQLYASEAPAEMLVPTIQGQPQSLSQAIGGDAVFTVTATGIPPVTYQWQFNGSNISGATNSALTISNAQATNAGTYDVIVCSGMNCTNSFYATLTLGTPPSISADPQSQHVLVGTNMSFTVTASGSAPLSYQWRFNGANVVGATDSVLNLSNVQSANAGSYAAVVTNAFGSATSAVATLAVDVAPTILTQPQSQTVAVGGTATFSVSATPILPNVSSGTLRLWLKADAGVVTNSSGVVQWQDQSGNTNDAAAPTVAAEPSIVYPAALGGRPAIRFDGIQDNVNGDYLYGSGDVGIPNAYTSFTVYNALQTTNNENLVTLVGYPGRYYGECRINGIGAGKMSFSGWAYDYTTSFTIPTNTYRIWTDRVDTNLSEVEIFDTSASSNTNFQYSISQFSAPAPGFFIGGLDPSYQYVVKGRNLNGDIAELIYYRGQLTDADRLAVEQYLKSKYLQQNGTGSGYTYQWQFNGVDVSGATNATLTISNAQTTNAGTYNVIVCSGICTTSSNATLTVYTPASITTQPVSQTVSAGTSATFTSDATGTGPLSYQWKHNGVNISGATTTALTITNAQSADSGSYSLVVTSPYGSVTSSDATLTVLPSTLVVGNVTGAGSSTINVPVSLIALGTENAVGFSLTFDPSYLSFSSVSLGSDASGATLFYNTVQQSSGKLGIVVSLPTGAAFNAGTQQIAIVTFNVGLVATGTVTTVNFGDVPTGREISDTSANILPASYIPGSVTLTATAFEGDVSPRPNGNQAVTITDWVQVGRFVAGLDVPADGTEFQRADCAPRSELGDGRMTVSDWVQAGRYAVGLDPLTPMGGPTTFKNGGAIMTPKTPVSRTVSLQTDAKNGITNVVSVDLNSQGNENAVGFSLTFDQTVIKFVGASVGSGAPGGTMNVNSTQASNGVVGIAVAMPFGQSFAAGSQECVRLSFVPMLYSSSTSNLVFTDSPVVREVSDVTANVLAASYVNSSLAVDGLVPSLTISQDGSGNVTLIWPAAATGYGLESVSDLNATWSPVSASATTVGTNSVLTQPASTNQVYFRLHKP